MSTEPAPGFKSQQYEFTEEHNRTLSKLSDSMRSVATLLQLVGLVFAIFFAVHLVGALQTQSHYGPAIGFAVGMILTLAMGFWTSGSAASFRKVVESKNEDVWHLMKALQQLSAMYSLMRTIILGTLVLAVVGVVLLLVNQFQK